MTNDFANISAESNLRDMIALSPMETEEANTWFDGRNVEAVASMDADEIPMAF